MLFRNRTLVRATACLLLVETVGNLAAPTLSMASMGPGQPEFTSYEAPGSTDMVNMTTGDFTYNIPVLDIPGPERSFSLPLTYRAGIRLEQEASWVGLGWSLNPGAIARSLNGYPDDAVNDPNTTTFKKDVNRGWTGGVPGVLDLAWDSETGHSGTADLIGLAAVGWANGKVASGDLVGVKYSRGNGVSVDPLRMASAALTIASVGAAGSAMAAATEVGKNLGTSVGMGVGASMILGKSGGSGGGFNRPTVRREKRFLHTNFWVFYNDNKAEMMYGSLYFNSMSRALNTTSTTEQQAHVPVYQANGSPTPSTKPNVFQYKRNYGTTGTETREVGADLQQYAGPQDEDYLKTSLRPISIAHDDFSVMGEGISGSIRPYRLEVGSLAFPKVMSDHHDKYNVVPFLDDYKVGFRYDNSLSNGYDYHDYTPQAGDNPVGIQYNASQQAFVLQDKRLFTSSTDSRSRTAADRKGIVSRPGSPNSRALVQGKHVKWYSNAEIDKFYEAGVAGNGNGFLEFQQPKPATVRWKYRSHYTCLLWNPDPKVPSEKGCLEYGWVYGDSTLSMVYNPFRKLMPRGSIGAFAITAEDGTTYHYSLPVYHYNQFSRTRELTADEGQTPGVSTQMLGEKGRDYGYATTWLLTAITSPDYVDRGKQGIVDDEDWGGWVKFEYGKFSRRYKWRQPYIGEAYPEKDMNTANFAEGSKQTYYLNAIHTRTHSALFIKSVRNDARGHFTAGMDSTRSHLAIDETAPSSSLRLDEIVLLTKEDYRKLTTPEGIRQPQDDSSPIPAFTSDTKSNNATYKTELGNRDTYEFVYDQHDVTADARIRTFINQRAQKRIVFNYSYRLCPGTPNSFASLSPLPAMDEAGSSVNRTGKLTLESLATFGPLNTKLVPDFVFTYGSNPTYGKEKWDGFGMYNSLGQKDLTSHGVSADPQLATADGAAWSLTSILNPLGSTTQIRYERDQYARVSEYGLENLSIRSDAQSSTITTSTTGIDFAQRLQVGDVINLKGNITARWGPCGPNRDTDMGNYNEPYNQNATVTEVTASYFKVTSPPIGPTYHGPNCPMQNLSFQGTTLLPKTTNGGDIRVAEVKTVVDNTTAYSIKYKYTGSLNASLSSGVISKLPEFIAQTNYPFYSWFDYPATSVMYGKVNVLRGAFRGGNEADYEQREEYSFYTPHSQMVRQDASNEVAENQVLQNSGNWTLSRRRNKTVIDVGKIGQPIAIRRFNRAGQQEFASTFAYTNELANAEGIAGQGTFTEGVLTTELLNQQFYHINRSTKSYIPTVLASTHTVANGVSVESFNSIYDFFTGQVLETTAKNSLGYTYRTKTVPAYTLTPYSAVGAKGGMGPKEENAANSNMLVQPAAFYTYKQVANGPSSLLSAGVQTWKSDWATYREYNAATERYDDRTAQHQGVELSQWRQHENYTWNGSALNPDGTFANFVPFNWQASPLSNQYSAWLNTGGVTRYDHYSKVVETRDLNGLYSSQKLGHGQTRGLVSGSNARYTEIAYSGAEDKGEINNIPGVLHFGGEVREGGKQNATYSHTGLYSSKLLSGETGFSYHARVGSEILVNRAYRLSTWVHESDLANNGAGRLYASVNGNLLQETSLTSTTAKRAGQWYLLNLTFTIPASLNGAATTGTQLVVGCKHAGGTSPVYFDDFRLQPVDGALTACVYDPNTWQVTHTLDNDNLYTRFQYDAAGKLVAVFKEVLTSGTSTGAEKKVKEYQYNYARGLQ